MGACRSLHAVPKLSHGNGSDLKMLIRLGCYPTLEIKSALLAADDYVRVQDYRHLSTGVRRVLRPFCRSSCQAAASSDASSTLATTSANSRPVQTFSLSGMMRATGEPFLRSTKVTF